MTAQEPVVLTADDFADGRLVSLQDCMLVLAHANLVGGTPAEEGEHSDARALLGMALEVAEAFPELQVGLLNCLDHPETAERLSVYVSEYGTRCAALLFTAELDPHFIAAGGNETPATLHQWALGILLAAGCRPTRTREEIIVRLACDLAEPPECDSADPRWDDVEIRNVAILAARETLVPLYEEWVPEFDARDLE
jgi:hypothetical protein